MSIKLRGSISCRCGARAGILWAGLCPAAAQPSDSPLQLEGKIPLGAVRGRIDHMAFDLDRRRLFVAELGNDSVGVVDLDARKVVHRIGGLKEPQGGAYLPSGDRLFVANGGDGPVRPFPGPGPASHERSSSSRAARNLRAGPAARPGRYAPGTT